MLPNCPFLQIKNCCENATKCLFRSRHIYLKYNISQYKVFCALFATFIFTIFTMLCNILSQLSVNGKLISRSHERNQ